MSFELGPPPLPPIKLAPPAYGMTVLPVRGPAGPAGPPGDASVDEFIARLEALEAEPRGFVQTVNAPATLVQIHHGLSFNPAGVMNLDFSGTEIEESGVSHPFPGITEVTFGAPFTGTITLS